MPAPQTERLRGIKTLPQLLAYLRDELDWPVDSNDTESVTFDYDPSELGLDEKSAVRIKEIKQLRPLSGNQPWGIFFINFEKKRLPVVVMRRILRALVLKKRASSKQAERQAWQPSDLLFISAYGEETDRAITFAHFVEDEDLNGLAELRVLGWDDDDTPLKYDYVAHTLQEKLRWHSDYQRKPDEWRKTWREAFVLRHREVIKTSQELALALADLAKKIRGRVRSVLRYEDGFGEIRKLQRAFQTALIHDLTDEGFADMFAQTVTYGLFSLACRRTIPGEGTAFVKEDLSHYFTSPFLTEMLGVFLGLKSRRGEIDFDELGIGDVTGFLHSPDTHMEAVLRDFGNKTRGEDPVIHFYEHFLTAYNKQLKIQRGVFYTPQPVVSYIVRSVHELLQTEFGLADGLADTTTWGEMVKKHPGLKLPDLSDDPSKPKLLSLDEPFVQILDIATGTGTFIVEVIDVIHKTMKAKWKKAGKTDAEIQEAWNDYVPKHLLPRVYGFELMMAPYAIAHMKVGLKLSETGYLFRSEDRVRIYLTNTLEPKVKQLPQIGFDALAHEAAAVNEIKWKKRFTVVIGNPPYAYASANTGKFISDLIEEYYFIDGCPLNERNPRGLQDDYVKFIRFGQAVIQNATCGVMGYITNHSYIDNPTFPGMRKSFLTTFQNIAVLDLHGNTKKGERCPDGGLDNNVFDIQQGVVITIASASNKPHSMPRVSHAELWGTRELKYRFLASHSVSDSNFSPLELRAPNYHFVPQNYDLSPEYESGWSIRAMMPTNSVGIVTSRDELAVHFSKQAAKDVISRLVSLPQEAARKEFQIGPDSQDWSLSAVRDDLRKSQLRDELFVKLAYRPFDVRWTFYTGVSAGFHGRPRREVMQHMLPKNVGLLTSRMTKGEEFAHTFVTEWVSEKIFLSPKTSNNSFHFPLYLYRSDDLLGCDGEKVPNYAPEFVKALCLRLGLLCDKTSGLPTGLTPEDIFHYAYAVFHSPGYRSRYAEFLKIDFPRLPLTGNLEMFRALARLGGELVALHLLESPILQSVAADVRRLTSKPAKESQRLVTSAATIPQVTFTGPENPVVEKVSYAHNTVWLDKAQTTGFKGVREDVWNFHIGGYQVCEKWLKDRKSRTLSKDDIAYYHKIVIALSETIRLMSEIDKVIDKYGGWPGAFTSSENDADKSPHST